MNTPLKKSERERLYLFDTTLRDGQQTAGVDFSVDDKQSICSLLDELGLDYIEGGYPGANPTDTTFFSTPRSFSNATLTAFGMTKRAGRSAENDPGLSMILDAEADAVCLVAKSWDYHVEVALGISEDENLLCIRESVEAIVRRGKEAMIDCEHFFDGYKTNPEYALACAKAAFEAGARWVVLCDTNGGTLPHEVGAIVAQVTQHIDGAHLGIHAHNDTENAVANSLAAIDAGVRQVQGTLNGLGERCGNANIVSLIPTLLLKPAYADRFETGVTLKKLESLTRASRHLDDVLNRTPNRHQPYVGDSAFAHKGGIHVSAVMKDPKTYEHVAPQAVGNERKILVSDQAGRSNILARLETAGIETGDTEAVDRILAEIKDKELVGYSYDSAGASFELLARRVMGTVPDFFQVMSYEVKVTNSGSEIEESSATATVTLKIDGEEITTDGQGNGPINALDSALRADLRRYAPYLKDLKLTDYKVRILNTGTGAVTRVVIESADGKANSWRTIGVSENVVAASFRALHDSIIYKLCRDGVSANPEG
ncbi:MAG: citramalate synthase [Parvibaculales bacterium]